jgi:hypothetical protein
VTAEGLAGLKVSVTAPTWGKGMSVTASVPSYLGDDVWREVVKLNGAMGKVILILIPPIVLSPCNHSISKFT